MLGVLGLGALRRRRLVSRLDGLRRAAWVTTAQQGNGSAMGQAREETEIRARTRVRRAAVVLLGESIGGTFACFDAARAGEVEAGIHDMRVAAKRLRERMRLFQPVYRRREFQAALGRIDELNDVLGAVRDTDVLGEQLGVLAGSSPVVDALCAPLWSDRQGHQARLNAFLDALAGDSFAGGLQLLVREARHSAKHAVASQTCRRFARIEIGVRLSKAQRRVSEVSGEEDATGLHRLRVANKHLRYAMEPFLPIFGKGLQTAHKRVCELHSVLGDLHDWDVLSARLAKWARKAAEPGQLEPLQQATVEQRARCYQQVAALLGEGGQPICYRQIAEAID